MSLHQIGPTSGTYSKIKNGKRWRASYRVDRRQSLEQYNTPWVPVLHHRCEQGAEQQTTLLPCVTREQATAAAERILQQLGYSRECAQ
jgi:hypothetical protein